MGEQTNPETNPDDRPRTLPADAPPEAKLRAYDLGGIATRNPDGTTDIVYDPATAEARERLAGPLSGTAEPVVEE